MSRESHKDLLAALDRAGFFEQLNSSESTELRDAVTAAGYAGVFLHPWRVFSADDEALAEGAVSETLERWAPAFDALKIAPFRGSVEFDDDGAMILQHAGKKTLLVSANEIEADENGSKPGNTWGLVGARLVDAVNDYISSSGSSERFYSHLGGNDHSVVLLSPEMFRLLTSHSAISARDRPYRRTQKWPNFGMP
jgi:hypothetical protein